MPNDTTTLQESEFVWRRLLDPMAPGALVWVLLFAFVLLLVMVAMAKREKLMFLGIGSLVLVMVSGIYVVLDGLLLNWALVSMFSWWLVLVPLLTIGVVYVCLMYGRDCHSITMPWAALLGLLRLSVYGLLTVCFLLPAIQNYETTVTESKILVVFDVSGSIDATDGMSRKTRLEHIVDFLDRPYSKGQGKSAKTFIEHLQDVAPVTCYRFGGIDDYEPADFKKGGQKWQGSDWHSWLEMKTDHKKETTDAWALAVKLKGGELLLSHNEKTEAQEKARLFEEHKKAIKDSTDIGGSIKKILEREAGSRIQAVIVFSDGRSNVPDQAALDEIVKQAGDKTKPFQIITVGVGDYKPVKKMDVDPLIAPSDRRIDDKKLEIHVPFTGNGLQNKMFEVYLYAKRVVDEKGEIIANPKAYLVGYERSAFGGGPAPSYQSDLEVVIADLHPDAAKEMEQKILKDRAKGQPKVKKDIDKNKVKDPGDDDTTPTIDDAKKKDVLGKWEVVAKVRVLNDEEISSRRASYTSTEEVQINEAAIRVLLFSSGPSRDYQFVKSMFARELEKKRVELTIYLQTNKDEQTEVTEDAQGIIWLPDFPTRLDAPKKGDKIGKDAPKAGKKGDPMNLKSYDVIVAFDADWEQLIPSVKGTNRLELVKEWVNGEHRGGLIFVSGPQHTGRLIPPPDPDKRKAWPLVPIFDLMPVILKRPAPNLKNETLHDSTIPYQLNFTADAKAYDFLQLDPKSNSPTGGWAEFFGPQKKWDEDGKVHPERGFYTYYRVEDIKPVGAVVLATFLDYKAPKTAKGKDQPYFVVFQVGTSGKTFYIGSGEMWRLRTYKEKYHQVFWQTLVRYVSARTSGKSYGQFTMKREWEPGSIEIQAEVRDKNFMFLDPKSLDPKKPLRVTIKQLGTGGGKDEKPREVELKPKNKTGKPDGQYVAVTSMPFEGRFELRIDIPDTATGHIKKDIVIKRKSLEKGDLRTDFPKLQNLASEPTPEVRKRLEAKLPDKDKDGGAPPGSSAAHLFFILALAEHSTECLERTPPATDTRKADREDLWNIGPMVYKLESWDDGPTWTLLGTFTATTGELLKTALFAIPALTLVMVGGVMMIGRRWLTAAGVMAALVAVEIGMVLVTSNLSPKELFNPSVLGVVLVVPALIGLVAAGILLLAERYAWVAIVTGAVLLHLLVLGVFYWIADLAWLESVGWLDALPVDFVWLLLLIGLLLSLEWFTRKMLRLA
jgi:hypothetical protein